MSSESENNDKTSYPWMITSAIPIKYNFRKPLLWQLCSIFPIWHALLFCFLINCCDGTGSASFTKAAPARWCHCRAAGLKVEEMAQKSRTLQTSVSTTSHLLRFYGEGEAEAPWNWGSCCRCTLSGFKCCKCESLFTYGRSVVLSLKP